jgi:hypothetical protein
MNDRRDVTLDELASFLREHDEQAALLLDRMSRLDEDGWVTVFEPFAVEGAVYVLAFLSTGDMVEKVLTRTGWDFLAGSGRPGFVVWWDGENGEQVEYQTVGAEGVFPLVFLRTFDGAFPKVVELAEDFRLKWDLFERRPGQEWVTTDDVGDVVVVAELRDGALRIRKDYLRKYQAARQLALVLQVVVDRRAGDELAHLSDVNLQVREGEFVLAYHGDGGMGGHLSGEDKHFTRLIGKRVVPAPPIERCGDYPFEPAARFATFIIDTDEEGEPVEYSADPDALANYFGANPDAPHFLTPVYFDRGVLDKYYADSDRYEIDDGRITSRSAWSLQIDNALEKHVVVFLGDLGGLPYREQQYWRSHNVLPVGGMSETAIRRAFLGEFADSTHVEHRFQATYDQVNAAWRARFGTPLYLEPHKGDAHLLKALHVPTNPSVAAFDTQAVNLAKVVVDSLNESGVSDLLGSKVAEEKGIAKLDRLGKDKAVQAVANLCSVLREVQGIRSRAAAHRKGGDFDVTVLLAGAPDLPTRFRRLLADLTTAFHALIAELTCAPEAEGLDR